MNQFTFMGYDGEIFEHISKYKARKLHLPKKLGRRPRWFKIGDSSSWHYG